MMAVGGGRVLFGDRYELTLARLEGDELVVLDNVSDAARWVDRLAYLGGDRVVFVNDNHTGIMELTHDKIRVRGTLLVSDFTSLTDFAAVGDRLWACTWSFGQPGSLVEFDVADPDQPHAVGDAVAGVKRCQSLAASADARWLYVAVGTDTLVVNVEGGAKVDHALNLPARQVQSRNPYVVVNDGWDAHVLRQSDEGEVAKVSGAISAAGMTAHGLLVRRYRVNNDRTEDLLSLYAVDPSASPPLTLRGEALLKQYGQILDIRDEAPWRSDDELGIGFLHIFQLGDDRQLFDEIRAPVRGSPAWLRVHDSQIYLRDDYTALRIDASDPAHPVRAVGGPHADPPYGYALEVPKEGPIGLSHHAELHSWQPFSVGAQWTSAASSFKVDVRRFDDDERPVTLAQHQFDLKTGFWRVTDRHVYRVSPATTDADDLRIQRWNGEQFAVPSGTPPLPLLNAAIPHSFGAQLSELFDDRGLAFAVASPAEPNDSTISLVGLHPTQASVVASAKVQGTVTGLAVAGDRVVALTSHLVTDPANSFLDELDGLVVVALERRGAKLVEVSRVSWPVRRSYRSFGSDLRHVVSFDGQTVYLQVTASDTAHSGLIALAFDHLDDEYVSYPAPSEGPIWSFAAGRMGIVYNSPLSGVFIARPWCQDP